MDIVTDRSWSMLWLYFYFRIPLHHSLGNEVRTESVFFALPFLGAGSWVISDSWFHLAKISICKEI